MILVSGFNIYSSEVEEVIGQMPGVLDCAAFGVPDDKAPCETNLTGYKRPRLIEFRDELPK